MARAGNRRDDSRTLMQRRIRDSSAVGGLRWMRGDNTDTSSRARPARLQLDDHRASVVDSRLPRLCDLRRPRDDEGIQPGVRASSHGRLLDCRFLHDKRRNDVHL